MDIKTLLEKEIQNEFELLDDMEVGTEEYVKTVDGLAKLMDRAIVIDKNESEVEEKETSRAIESDFRERQLNEDKKDRLTRNCIAAAGIIIPSIITIWGTLKTLKFEEEGTITTIMGRGFINKLLPKK